MRSSKSIVKAYNKRYYERNQEKLVQEKRAKRAERRRLIDEIKSVPCVDCNRTYPPVCMDFDHVRGTKLEGVAQMVLKSRTWQAVLDEIAKCEIVCANCHRIRHDR